MIEFVMSRVWMVIAGLAVAAVILAAFGGLNDSIAGRHDTVGAESLAKVIEELEAEDCTLEMRLSLEELMVDREEVIVIHPGSIWVIGDSKSRAVACSSNIALLDNGQQVDELRLGCGDTLVIRTSSGTVQLEKVSTM